MTTTRKSRRGTLAAAAAAVAGLGLFASALPAQAMGTGNPYEDIQVGVTYTVYQPSFTAGLKTPKKASGDGNCPSGTEENLVVKYGTNSGLQFTVFEGNPICSDPGAGVRVMTAKVNGATAKVFAYCDSAASCMRQDVKKDGGYLLVTLPAASGLRKVMVEIETSGTTNLSARQLLKIARSLQPVQ